MGPPNGRGSHLEAASLTHLALGLGKFEGWTQLKMSSRAGLSMRLGLLTAQPLGSQWENPETKQMDAAWSFLT